MPNFSWSVQWLLAHFAIGFDVGGPFFTFGLFVLGLEN
jgi:hypothetical protein